MPLPHIIKIFQTIKKLRSAQEFGLEIHSGEITWKKEKKELSFLHVIFLLDLMYVPTKYYQIISNSIEVMAYTKFLFQGEYIKKKVSIFSFAHYIFSGPYLCLYQILSKYFKPLRSYRVNKNLA